MEKEILEKWREEAIRRIEDDGYDAVKSFEYGPAYVEMHFDWHRGVIALPYGNVSFSGWTIEPFLKMRKGPSTEIAWEAFDRLFSDGKIPRKFGSSYTEFLYPGSPGYGFNLDMPYVDDDAYTEGDFKLDYSDDYSRGVVKRGYLKFRKIVEAYNDVLYEVEKLIIDITKYVEAWVLEEEREEP